MAAGDRPLKIRRGRDWYRVSRQSSRIKALVFLGPRMVRKRWGHLRL